MIDTRFIHCHLLNKRTGPTPRLLKRRHSGQALVLFAIMILTLLAGVALAIDTGMIWLNRRVLQNAVDAAALAGAQQLPDDTSGARAIACDYAANKNGIQGMTLDCDGSDIQILGNNDKIKVTTHKTIVPMIGTMFGWPSIDIAADATARVGSLYQACPFPIFQTPEMLPPGQPGEIGFYQLTALHLAGADNQSGNFLTVDVGSGANAVFDAIVNNSCSNPIGPTASTEPGGKIGKVVDGLQWRVACATGGPKPNGTPACPPGPSACPSDTVTSDMLDASGNLKPSINRDNCTRLVILPIFPGPFNSYNGKTTVTILGFAVYYIGGVCPPSGNASTCPNTPVGELKKGDAWGYYVRMEATSSTLRPYDGFGTKVVTLID